MTQTLLHGDCLELLPTLADGSVDMVFCDLPYAHMANGKVRKCTANAWDTPIDLEALWKQLLRVGKRNAAFVFTATFDFAVALRCSQPRLSCYDSMWDKGVVSGFLNANRQPLRRHEQLLVFSRYQPTYNPQKIQGARVVKQLKPDAGANYGKFSDTRIERVYNERFPTSVVYFPCPRVKSGHPTQKPVALLEWLIRTYTNPGETVLDPTCGSATTLVACQNTGRHGIGIEKDATYYAIAQRRLAEHQPPLPGAA